MRFYRNLFPFKPFKSKRGMLQGIDELKQEIHNVGRQQRALIQEWKSEAEIDGLKLELHKQGAPYVRWRLNQTDSAPRKYITLFRHDTQALTESLSEDALEMICAFEHHRVLVNCKSKSLHTTLASLEFGLEELQRMPLETLEAAD